MPSQAEAAWGLTFSPLDKAQEPGGGPSVRENDLEFVTSPGQGAKKVYCCPFLSLRFVEANHYWYQGRHGRDSVRGRCLLIVCTLRPFYRKRTSGVTLEYPQANALSSAALI